MITDVLIRSLAADIRPVPRHAVGRRLAVGIAGGAIVTVGVIILGFGIRPDIALAMRGYSFWMKWAYTISLAIGALVMAGRLALPETVRRRRLWLPTIPMTLLALLAGLEMAHAPPADWLTMWLGQSWMKCPWLVLMLSAPIFIGLLWSFRRLAPTRLRAAGTSAGFASGACAATLYCLHCPEVSALFILTWYTLGIGLAAAIGALVGPRRLRW